MEGVPFSSGKILLPLQLTIEDTISYSDKLPCWGLAPAKMVANPSLGLVGHPSELGESGAEMAAAQQSVSARRQIERGVAAIPRKTEGGLADSVVPFVVDRMS
jgi:hypothetical protein